MPVQNPIFWIRNGNNATCNGQDYHCKVIRGGEVWFDNRGNPINTLDKVKEAKAAWERRVDE